ncbi:GntR family transcriptional regulator [Sagittula stellata]|uniref:Transcriptional regulator, GntR family protein n=2 Tax=Sagittula stellata TaxID=52603 RepID=A3K4G9_SAGS3|nr:transcriptional regulator, GntR family protein [Sagittula stellata E-37]
MMIVEGKAGKGVKAMAKISAAGAGAEDTGGPMSLGEKVYAEMKAAIIVGDFRQGAIFNEADLAARFSVSTSPVKEALSRLRQDGLVRVIGRRGYAVTELTLQDFHDLIEIRIVLECAACELAAPRVTDEHVAQMSALSSVEIDLSDSQSRRAFTRANQDFHELIPAIAGNVRILRAIQQNFVDMQRALFVDIARGDEVGLVHDHDEIIGSLARRDPRGARDAMYRHIIQARDRVIDRMMRRHSSLQHMSLTPKEQG